MMYCTSVRQKITVLSLLLWIFISGVSDHALAAPVLDVSAAYGKSVGELEVTGLKRIEKDAVLGKVITKSGQILSAESVRADIYALHAMGYFEEIEVHADSIDAGKVKVVYKVKERPVVSQITFEGNERVTTSDLQEVIKVKQWSILDHGRAREDVVLLQRHYEEKGFYLAKVQYELKPVEGKPDETALVYKINDYEKVQIKKITFLNNRQFSDEMLKNILAETKEGGMWSFMTNSGNFKESSFKTDLQRLTYWYLDHGYVKFKYDNPIITVSDDKRWLYVTIYVDEGEQYKMGNLEFSGDLLYSREELKSGVTLLEEETFSVSKRNQDIEKLQEKYKDLGYAFVNVIPKMNVKDDTKTVDIDYSFEKGNLVYFGEINVLGNSKTHDKVIRRELRIHEGELYSGTKIRESKENVERLGFFAPGEIVFNEITPKDKPDVLNVDIGVKERSTGTITLGAGYSSGTGPFLTAQIAEINLLGRGQNLSFSGQYATDSENKSFNLGFTEPYFRDTRWSTGFDVYYVTFGLPNKYNTRKLGFDFRLGYPFWDYTYGYITYKHDGMRLYGETPGVDLEDKDADTGITSSVTLSMVHDRRNNRFETSGGHYESASMEFAGLGGNKRFSKMVLDARYYKRLIGDLVFRSKAEYGQLWNLEDGRTPPSERFYLGGPTNLRGYRFQMVGPVRTRYLTQVSGNQSFTFPLEEPRGGNVQFLGMVELEYPLIREAGLKFVTFMDAGNVFERFPSSDVLRGQGGPLFQLDAGLGIRWFSPIGPLRFEWGFPLNPRSGLDGDSEFVFFIGPPF